jgi:two-component system OmpR family response regulator
MHPVERTCGGRPCKLLIIDDERPILDLLGETALDEGFQVTLAADLPGALAALTDASFDLVLADALAEFTTGFAIDQWSALEAIRDHAGKAGVIIFSAHPAHQFEGYQERGFREFIAKPFDLDALLATLRFHLAAGRREREAVPRQFAQL